MSAGGLLNARRVADTMSKKISRLNHGQGFTANLITSLSEQMHTEAAELQFEVAARLRDEIGDLKKELRGMLEAGV